MKIGMLSTSKQLNYGGVLQAYALLSVVRMALNQATIESINIDITKNSEELFGESYRDLARIGSRAVLKRWAVRLLHPIRMMRHRRRRNRTQQFLNDFLCQSQTVYHTPQALWRQCPYDLIVVGSDQVWRHQSRIHEFCLLSGLEETNVRRIAYAVSLGWQTLPESSLENFVSSIKRFNAISIREPSSVNTVATLLNYEKPVGFCLDPSLLFGRDNWKSFLEATPMRTAIPQTQYAFVYWLADMDKLTDIFQGLISSGFKKIVVVFPWYQKVLTGKPKPLNKFMSHAANEYGVEWAIDAGPNEFLHLLAGADYVVANSFHAMMFSLVFKKPMRIFTNITGANDPMAPRMLDFAERYAIDGVVFKGIKNNCDFTSAQPLDFTSIWNRLEPDRKKSMEFLLTALAECGCDINPALHEVL